ncbi:restriction endonuclease [Chromobacterium amazonense]|uniref:type II restriction endonuclease n=1 Tax=Chromobacterium amazonense TaxID=1382803 RepID=UPI0008DA8327|nr:type II restriction endonuclease [Chromobacterium amazonense]OHX17982.1 restriction endonuclease [Chromobacterium amazonense]
MFEDRISDYTEGVAAKYLSAVDAEPGKSHQHEIGGLPAAGFREWLGTPGKEEEYRFRARQIYIPDDDDEPIICDSHVTWYDCCRKVAHRGPEYRLYYHDSPVTTRISEGDFFLVAKLSEEALPLQDLTLPADGAVLKPGSLLMVFAPAGSAAERQLRQLFGLGNVGERFKAGELAAGTLLLPLRMMLETLGIELNKPARSDDEWIRRLLTAFGGKTFPATSDFSAFARDSIAEQTDALADPDNTLMAWMDHEEKLFRLYERHLVQIQLRSGFGEHGDDVDAFISYSLSVQNRRKSRVGHAFEGHLDTLFRLHGLQFQQGRGKGNVTENNARPDFIFPSFAAYHDSKFPVDKLIMLGAKTTCKDRWRQVLSEASRILSKHLITLEAAISESQTDEMTAHQLQLVLPTSIHATYTTRQQMQIQDLNDFILHVKATQST